MAEYRTLAEAIRRDLGPGLMPDPRNVDIIAALIAAHFAALVARAEAGARLADDVEYAEKLLPLSSDSGVLRQALAAYRKATA